ncbi:MAG: glycosyltransferase family 1 protein, partial [Parcubacteria group bacterium CG_4_10_14_0_2_um_filter_41_6]
NLNVKDRVMFTGGIKDEALIKLYKMAYVTVLPSIDQSEAFGIVLVESMACATPVIASDLPGVRSVFEDSVTGFVSSVRDEKDIAAKLSSILDDPDKRNQMSDACVQLVAQKYNWDKIGDILEQMTKSKCQMKSKI